MTTYSDKTAAEILTYVAGHGGHMAKVDRHDPHLSIYSDLVARGLLEAISLNRGHNGEYIPDAVRLTSAGEAHARQVFRSLLANMMGQVADAADAETVSQLAEAVHQRRTFQHYADYYVYTKGETPWTVALLKAIAKRSHDSMARVSWTMSADGRREFTRETVAEAAGRENDWTLWQDLAYLRAMRLIDGKIEGVDDRWAEPSTVMLTGEGTCAVAEGRLAGESPKVTAAAVEIVRALCSPTGGRLGRVTVNHPAAEIAAMDESQRARMEAIRQRLEDLVLPGRGEVGRQLHLLRELMDELDTDPNDHRTLKRWLSRLDEDGAPRRYRRPG